VEATFARWIPDADPIPMRAAFRFADARATDEHRPDGIATSRGWRPTGGLLRRIPADGGVLVLKDFTSIIDMHRDGRTEVLAALREIYDGRWDRNVGAEGADVRSQTRRSPHLIASAPESHAARDPRADCRSSGDPVNNRIGLSITDCGT
jgi:hypothetical protein